MGKIIKCLDRVVYWSIVAIPFSIAIAPAFTNTFMGFLFFSYFVKKAIKRERLFVATPINLPFILLILISIISFKNSIAYQASFRGITKLMQNAFLFLICAEEIKDRRHISRIVLFIIFGATLASVDALWQIYSGRDFIRGHTPIINIGLKRATAAFPNANVLGVYLSAITPLLIGLALYYYKGFKKILMLLICALACLGIILTFSRPTALALYLSILFICIYKKDKAAIAILLIFLLITPFILPKNIKDWAREIKYNPIIFMCNTDRVSVYKNTLNMIRHHPLIGVGVNTFSRNYMKYKLPEPESARTTDFMYAHNHFLQMAGEIGLLGLGIFFWLLFRLFKFSLRGYKNLKDDYCKAVSLSLIACLLAFLVNGLTETSLYYARVAMIFWYLIGFSFSLNRYALAGI